MNESVAQSTPDAGWIGPEAPGSADTVERTGRSVFLRSTRLLALSLVPIIGGNATAHPGGGSASAGHLVADVVGILVFAFVVYLTFAFARRVLYPRFRGYLSRLTGRR